MSEEKDYRVVLRVKNNKLLTAMERAGIKTMVDLSKLSGVPLSAIYAILALKAAGRTKVGEWRSALIKLSEYLKVLPEDLMPEAHEYSAMAKNKSEMFLSFADVEGLLESHAVPLSIEDDVYQKELPKIVAEELTKLDPRSAQILRMLYGLGGEDPQTRIEVGKAFGITGNRVAQIERRSMRMLAFKKESRLRSAAQDLFGKRLRPGSELAQRDEWQT